MALVPGTIDSMSLKELLIAPVFRREEYSSHLFIPYSRKLRRRVHLYTPNAYSLWVILESDTRILQFNERVPKIAVPSGPGTAVNARPDALSVDIDGGVTCHSLPSENSKDAEVAIEAWENWAAARGYRHIAWTRKSLGTETPRLASLKRLLRFVSRAGAIPNLLNDEVVLAELKGVRKTTIAGLLERLSQLDPDEVWLSIAGLIVDGKIFSDINYYPLSMITELSAYCDINEK